MKPTLILGDCRKIMKRMEPAQFDIAIADPPYGETSLGWDRRVDGWLPELRRVLKPTASIWCFGSLRFFMESADDFHDAGWRVAQEIVWEKHNGSNFHADRFKRVHELIVQFYSADCPWDRVYKNPQYTQDATPRALRRKKRPPHTGHIEAGTYKSQDGGPRLMRSVIYQRSCHGMAIHPTQKPVDLIIPLIKYSCPEGGSVLDPFAGSGSTGIAAKVCGRRSTLIEADPAMFNAASRRLDEDAPLFPAEFVEPTRFSVSP